MAADRRSGVATSLCRPSARGCGAFHRQQAAAGIAPDRGSVELKSTIQAPLIKKDCYMPNTIATDPDVVLIGAGIMSATLGVFLKELEPSLSIEMLETLEGPALESSVAWK